MTNLAQIYQKLFYYLVSVDTNSDHITTNEDHNNGDEEHRDFLVSSLSRGYTDSCGTLPDGQVQEQVHD